ncbi:hypothetical protein ACFQY7_47790 [Actinomadura luteofluorescens]|uniref:hypothetical protein n=1 Tax=Actinomadura luteofluorescens TaxID=46163 RepID=UPI003632AAB1
MTSTETVLTDQLALEIARLGMVGESSDVGTLHRVTELAARAVPGCAGAASVRWALPSPHGLPDRASGMPDMPLQDGRAARRRTGPNRWPPRPAIRTWPR